MYLTDLANIARSAGLKVVERSGWKARGRGPMSGARSIMCHHTAGAKTGNAPSLNLVQNGRTGLPGPLAQIVLGRDGTVYIVAAGRSNHAGVVSAAKYQNAYSIGIEAENTGLSNDPWPRKQYDAYVRLAAALAIHYKIPVTDIVGHREAARPAGRKIDPTYSGAFKSMAAFRADVKNIMEDDMPLSNSDIQKISKAVWDHAINSKNEDANKGKPYPAHSHQANTNARAWDNNRRLEALEAKLDKLTEAVERIPKG